MTLQRLASNLDIMRTYVCTNMEKVFEKCGLVLPKDYVIEKIISDYSFAKTHMEHPRKMSINQIVDIGVWAKPEKDDENIGNQWILINILICKSTYLLDFVIQDAKYIHDIMPETQKQVIVVSRDSDYTQKLPDKEVYFFYFGRNEDPGVFYGIKPEYPYGCI